MPRCAVYARFSTDRQSATSAEDQIASCAALAEREGWEVVQVYTDIAISGASNRRPGMTAMLSDAQAGAFDIVCAEAIDRIARNQADIATIYQRLEFAGVRIRTVTEGEVNELHIGLKGTMSALFLKDLADKIRRGQRGTVSRGRSPGGLAYGYDVVPQLGENGQLVRGLRTINAEQAAVVLRIYREYLAGVGPKAIAIGLNRDGVPSPRGGEWRASAILGSRARGLGVLHNPIYAGRYLYNRVTMKRDPETRRRVSRVNAAEDRLSIDMPELRIVPEELWQAVQRAAEARSTGPMNHQVRPKHLLSGLIRCGRCGGAFAGVNGKRLGCTRAREAGTCEVRQTINRDEIEQRVLAGITEQLLGPDAVSLLVRTYHREIAESQSDRDQRIAGTEKRLRAADKAIGRLVAAIADGAADFADIREALVARRAERDALRHERAELEAVPVIALNPSLVEAYRKRVRQLALSLNGESVTSEEVKARLRDIIEGVRILPNNTGGWEIEVLSALGPVVAIAKGKKAGEGFKRSVVLVAEESYPRNRTARAFRL